MLWFVKVNLSGIESGISDSPLLSSYRNYLVMEEGCIGFITYILFSIIVDDLYLLTIESLVKVKLNKIFAFTNTPRYNHDVD